MVFPEDLDLGRLAPDGIAVEEESELDAKRAGDGDDGCEVERLDVRVFVCGECLDRFDLVGQRGSWVDSRCRALTMRIKLTPPMINA
jgi:hypothetical protein